MSFDVAADPYDRFMGRYSTVLAPSFADFAGVQTDQRALDVGCGPGALTTELVARLGADSVAAVDPSEPIFQRYAIPLQSVQGIDAGNIANMRFRFDVTPAGMIYMDDVAMAREPSASGG